MNIQVEHLDTAGVTHNKTFSISRLAFAKHLAIAGQGYEPRPQKFLRTIGMFFHYSYYLQRQAFNSNRFSELSRPEIGLHKKRVNYGSETDSKRGNNSRIFNWRTQL